ncbi:MAG: periplasmic heavy metal sensor [Bacteroidota bacterium]
MRKLLLMLFIAVSGLASGQDVFQKQLFSTDLILKYRDDINLSEEKIREIKKIYNDHITTFNMVRWDLDAQMAKMNKLLAAETVDEKESQAVMDLILDREEQLKKMRFEMMVKLKNMLNMKQQKQLHELRVANGEATVDFVASMNENPRVSLKIRGEDDAPQPLIIVKDRKRNKIENTLDDLDPDDIESITVLKGESAIEKHGKAGENGVVIIVLK